MFEMGVLAGPAHPSQVKAACLLAMPLEAMRRRLNVYTHTDSDGKTEITTDINEKTAL